MEKSRLITVFETLSRQELRELRKFVQSPYFNQQQEIVHFLDYMTECTQLLKVLPNKEKAFQKIFPNQPFSDVKVRLLMSDLHKLIEKYLVCKNVFADKIQTKIQLAETYRQRNLPKHFQKTIRNARELLEQNPLRHAEYFNLTYKQLREHFLFTSSSKRIDEFNLQEISDTLDTTFITLKLQQTCLLLSHQAVYKKEYHFGLLQDIITYIEEQNLLEIPAISVYYYCFHSLTRDDSGADFRKFKELIFEHDEKFPVSEIRDLYLFALNYCIRQLNRGQKQYAQEYLDLCKEGLKKEILLQNKQLSRFTYNNIVASALRVKDFEWADDFIQKYKAVLEKRYQESTYVFNMARLEYERKNYDLAMQLLQKADFGDLLNNLISKTLLLKIYFELDEYNLLESHLDTMKTFIRRKTKIGYHQTNYLNIIRYTKKLLTTNLFDKSKKEALQKSIETEEILTERNWLLAQLD